MKKKYIITGAPEQLEIIEDLLCHIQYLGDVGASRNLLVRMDGDGDYKIGITDESGERLNNKKYSTEQDEMYHCSAVYDLG